MGLHLVIELVPPYRRAENDYWQKSFTSLHQFDSRWLPPGKPVPSGTSLVLPWMVKSSRVTTGSLRWWDSSSELTSPSRSRHRVCGHAGHPS
mmetsp:Transcript_70371/g.168573  ORF Transcript_70371/g.168573 Transcript_70371/m.168573 type:complete len:92 (-) Transcript_70371:114-389(-)